MCASAFSPPREYTSKYDIMCVNGFPRASRSNFFEATPPRHLTAHASPVRTLLTPSALNHIHCDIVDLLRLVTIAAFMTGTQERSISKYLNSIAVGVSAEDVPSSSSITRRCSFRLCILAMAGGV